MNWKYGATKSLVVLTDANFLSPDRDGMTFDEVVRLSKTIDPVNFYIITTSSYGSYYNDLAQQTDGLVVTNLNELSLLTDYIIERYDSLPRVEENTNPAILPTLEITETKQVDDDVRIKFDTNGTRTLVVLNDTILGITEETEITISGLHGGVENRLTLIPLGDDVRGEGVEVVLTLEGFGEASGETFSTIESPVLPKAPNTGRR